MSPVSEKQLAANRANAAKSTGPRTAAGKARSALNSVKHGFATGSYNVVLLEDGEEVDKLRADLIHHYQPQTSEELFAIERLALCRQTILRAHSFEAGVFSLAMDEAIRDSPQPGLIPGKRAVKNPPMFHEQNHAFLVAQGMYQLAGGRRKGANMLQLVLRYHAQADREYRRALEALERLIALRLEIPNEPISDAQFQEEKAVDPPENEAESGALSAGSAPVPEPPEATSASPAPPSANSLSAAPPAASSPPAQTPLADAAQQTQQTQQTPLADPPSLWQQNDNVPFEQSRNVLLTAPNFGDGRRDTTDDTSRS